MIENVQCGAAKATDFPKAAEQSFVVKVELQAAAAAEMTFHNSYSRLRTDSYILQDPNQL